MMPISTGGFKKPRSISAGADPILRWLAIADLVIDPALQQPISRRGRRNVNRIAQTFSWSCFSPVIVAQFAQDKFVIIDGQHRTTAAALIGFDRVPCQVVTGSPAQLAVARKAINGQVTSRLALHVAATDANENLAVQLSDICARTDVELLRYPVPVDRQTPGQTMAVGALAQSLKRYGEETLISALQCVTQTPNNRPGMLSARMIKALCAVLHNDKKCRDSGLALLEAFDEIDLAVLATTAAAHAAGKKASPVQTLMELIRSELDRRFVGSDPRYQQQPGIVSQRLASARQNTGVKANPVVRAKPGGSATAAYEFRDNPRVKRLRLPQPRSRQRPITPKPERS